jgi:ubiquinone/menaquinone biosynthesis C-methylase UbiE
MESLAYLLLGLAGFVALVVIVSRRHSVPCQVWLSWLIELDNPFSRINRAAVIIEHLDLKPGMSVLDLGCGPGRLAVPVAQQVGPQGQVVAVDVQAGMLQRAEEKARRAGVANIRFLQAGAGEGKLDRDRFDRALLVTVLGEIPKQQAALNEIFAALRPGGILSVTEIIFDPHFQTRGAVRRMAE